MRVTLVALMLTAAAVFGGGCSSLRRLGGRSSNADPLAERAEQPDPETEAIRRENRELKASNIILADRIEELVQRNRRMEQKLRQAKFDIAQMKRQVDALADAPAERDRYKKLARQLAMDLGKLKAELAHLREALADAEARPPELSDLPGTAAAGDSPANKPTVVAED